MDFQSREEEFYNRFGLDTPQFDNEVLEKSFRAGVMNFLDELDNNLGKSQIKRFCSWYGETYQDNISGNIYKILSKEQNFNKFLFKLESVFSLNFALGESLYKDLRIKYQIELYHYIKEIFDNSKLPIGFERIGGQVIIFPQGCDFLDKELVIKTLKYLDENSHKHFSDALHHYMESKYIKSAESIRRTVEEFLKYKLESPKGLEKNISLLLNTIKSQSLPEIRNTIHKTFDCLDKLFNEHSKHNDGDITENECEYLIYQSALLMRYVDKALKK
ncbi:hypothetical protein [Legionella sp. W05-934-2]|uniref:hypothetical protein n=1 Tax=Legionella sp. W05-934-2 TaxID=1198649 RepID=UPI00346191C6